MARSRKSMARLSEDMANTLKIGNCDTGRGGLLRRRGYGHSPGRGGSDGNLPQHVRLMTQLVPGEMVVQKGGHDDFLAVGEGLVEVTNKRVAIVTDMAVVPRTSTRQRPKKRVNAPRRGSGTTLFRGSRFRQRLFGSLAGATARQTAPSQLSWCPDPDKFTRLKPPRWSARQTSTMQVLKVRVTRNG